jgi:hypothetical protein
VSAKRFQLPALRIFFPVNANDPLGLWSVSLEAYAGVGGGITAAYQNGTFELLGRIGVGLGAGFQYEPQGGPSKHAQPVGAGYIARTFTTLQAEVGAGPVGIGGGVTYRSGNAVTTPVGGDYFAVSGTTLSLTNEVSKPSFGLRVGGAYGTEIGSYSNWGNSAPSSSVLPSPAKPATPNVSWDFITQPSSGNQSLRSFEQLSAPGAAGGFLLYPNRSNTNMMRSVYRK